MKKFLFMTILFLGTFCVVTQETRASGFVTSTTFNTVAFSNGFFTTVNFVPTNAVFVNQAVVVRQKVAVVETPVVVRQKVVNKTVINARRVRVIR